MHRHTDDLFYVTAIRTGKHTCKKAPRVRGFPGGTDTGHASQHAHPFTRSSGRFDADEFTLFRTFGFELDFTVGQSEERVVLTNTHVSTSVELGAALTNDDVACCSSLAAEQFYAEAFGLGVASVTRTTCCLLVSHCSAPSSEFVENACQKSGRNAGDFDFGEPLTVALTLHVVLTATELDDSDLITAAVRYDFSSNLGTVNNRGAYFDVVASNQQDFVESNGFTSSHFQLFELDGLAFLNAVLLTAALDNCVHGLLQRTHLFCYLGRPASSGSTLETI
ncbi:SAM-dependent methyltransferases [Zymobacter palmae]|uniref:SAM-dependent methyltransferases n=1 Tax=Zymobacter palmae TaxID=33074 RepID=A0A348HC08_9GAMM|nr:SAM-dependent methyltransferases [Zymobacter palmae]